MGSEAKTALNILMWDQEHIHPEILQEILQGGIDKITESGAVLLGGHTVNDKEQKYGLSVSGISNKIWRNNGAKVGDVLLLVKPIGSGIITTALKNEKLTYNKAKECIDSMKQLNLQAMRVGRRFDIHACTDITGFGLIGHLIEMCSTDMSIELYCSQVPIFSQVSSLLNEGVLSGGSKSNQKYFSDFVDDRSIKNKEIFYDAQTSGGIVFALKESEANSLLKQLQDCGYEKASIIGVFKTKNEEKRIFLK